MDSLLAIKNVSPSNDQEIEIKAHSFYTLLSVHENSFYVKDENGKLGLAPMSALVLLEDVEEDEKKVCYMCGEDISEKYLNEKGTCFHVGCFKCFHCKTSLLGEINVLNGKNILCRPCYVERLICEKCNEVIMGDYLTAMGKNWHKDHFVCEICGKKNEDTYHNYEEKPYCEDCFVEKITCICSVCEEIIDAKEKRVKTGDLYHHIKCFVCHFDSEALDVNETIKFKGKNIFCEKHYDEIYQICEFCKKPLLKSYVSMCDKNYHKECITCEECGVNLVDSGPNLLNGKILCKIHRDERELKQERQLIKQRDEIDAVNGEKKCEQFNEKKCEQSNEKKGEQIDEKKDEQSKEKKDEQIDEKKCEQSNEKKIEQIDEKKGEQSNEKKGEQFNEKKCEQSNEKKIEQIDEKKIEQSNEKKIEQIDEKKIEQSNEKKCEQSSEKKCEQSNEKKIEQIDEKKGEQIDEKKIEQIDEKKDEKSDETEKHLKKLNKAEEVKSQKEKEEQENKILNKAEKKDPHKGTDNTNLAKQISKEESHQENTSSPENTITKDPQDEEQNLKEEDPKKVVEEIPKEKEEVIVPPPEEQNSQEQSQEKQISREENLGDETKKEVKEECKGEIKEALPKEETTEILKVNEGENSTKVESGEPDIITNMKDQLCKKFYSLEDLISNNISSQVIKSRKEDYLTKGDFEKIFKMTSEKFKALPLWRQKSLKKDVGLY